MEAVDAAADGGGSSGYGSVGAGADVMNLGSMDGGFAWADQSNYFHHV
jgi:hypothetical protein